MKKNKKEAIKKHLKKHLKKEEAKHTHEPVHHYHLKTGKIHIHRPENYSDNLKKYNSSIKKAIQEKLSREDSNLEHKDIKKKLQLKQRVPIGIAGLDNLMEGGLRKGATNIVAGTAGAGKSIFSMQFLINGIDKFNEPSVYISFEENEKKILEDFEKFNWNLDEKIKNKKLVILHYPPERIEKIVELGGTVGDIIEDIGAKRIVVDSITAFTLLHKDDHEKRTALLKLFNAIEKWGCTALLASEQESDIDHHQSAALEFEVDGVILLYNIRKGDVRERCLEIFKMRGTHHAAKIYPMKITDNGITIFPEESVF